LIVMTCCKPLVVTAGEPAGIGPELCVALASERLAADIVVLSDPDLLRARAALTGKDVLISEIDPADVGTRRARDDELLVLAERFPVSAEVGIPNPENAAALLTGLRRAVDGCCIGHFAGLVTAPLQKSVINDAGIRFSGHTEFLAELTGVRRPVMLLVAGDLRVALASTHLPLREVPDYLTQDGLREGGTWAAKTVTSSRRSFVNSRSAVTRCADRCQPTRYLRRRAGTRTLSLRCTTIRAFRF
jgi:4-hydroxythreonine-4-phosphate dehydrogenase